MVKVIRQVKQTNHIFGCLCATNTTFNNGVNGGHADVPDNQAPLVVNFLLQVIRERDEVDSVNVKLHVTNGHINEQAVDTLSEGGRFQPWCGVCITMDIEPSHQKELIHLNLPDGVVRWSVCRQIYYANY